MTRAIIIVVAGREGEQGGAWSGNGEEVGARAGRREWEYSGGGGQEQRVKWWEATASAHHKCHVIRWSDLNFHEVHHSAKHMYLPFALLKTLRVFQMLYKFM